MTGESSLSVNGMIWSSLDQFAVSGGYTKMEFEEGQLKAIHSYGTTVAYLKGTYMNMLGYTWIKPDPKYGTYGYNVGMINLLMKNPTNGKYNYNIMTSAVAFWTKPFQYSKKLTLSPQIFTMYSPIGYNTFTGNTSVGRQFGFLVGSSFDYKITKRFGFSFNYKLNINTTPGSKFTNNFLIGTRMIL